MQKNKDLTTEQNQEFLALKDMLMDLDLFESDEKFEMLKDEDLQDIQENQVESEESHE